MVLRHSSYRPNGSGRMAEGTVDGLMEHRVAAVWRRHSLSTAEVLATVLLRNPDKRLELRMDEALRLKST